MGVSELEKPETSPLFLLCLLLIIPRISIIFVRNDWGRVSLLSSKLGQVVDLHGCKKSGMLKFLLRMCLVATYNHDSGEQWSNLSHIVEI